MVLMELLLLMPQTDQNLISENSFFDNVGLAIDINNDGVTENDGDDSDTGANQEMNFPEIDFAEFSVSTNTLSLSGSLTTETPLTATVEVYVADEDPTGNGEGVTFIGRTTPTDGTGAWSLQIVGALQGQNVTAIARDANGNTSEFGDFVLVESLRPETTILFPQPNDKLALVPEFIGEATDDVAVSGVKVSVRDLNATSSGVEFYDGAAFDTGVETFIDGGSDQFLGTGGTLMRWFFDIDETQLVFGNDYRVTAKAINANGAEDLSPAQVDFRYRTTSSGGLLMSHRNDTSETSTDSSYSLYIPTTLPVSSGGLIQAIFNAGDFIFNDVTIDDIISRTHHTMSGAVYSVNETERFVTAETSGVTSSGHVIVLNISTPENPKVTNPSIEGVYSVPAITYDTSDIGGENSEVLDFGMTALVPIGDFGSDIEADVDTNIAFTVSGTRIDLGNFATGDPVLVSTGTQILVTTNAPGGYVVNVTATTSGGLLTKIGEEINFVDNSAALNGAVCGASNFGTDTFGFGLHTNDFADIDEFVDEESFCGVNIKRRVVESNVPVTDEITTIDYKANAPLSQASGIYYIQLLYELVNNF